MIIKKDLLPAFNYCIKRFHIKNPPKLQLSKSFKIWGVDCNGAYNGFSNIIKINRQLKKQKAIHVLFHEFIHCHQYNCGKMKLLNNLARFWKNKLFEYPKTILEILNSPWEKEASYKSDVLYNDFRKKQDK